MARVSSTGPKAIITFQLSFSMLRIMQFINYFITGKTVVGDVYIIIL